MKKYACRYAIVRFAPYLETGEFANVGIVLVCPETGFFGYRLQTRKFARVTAFFEELKANVYRRALHLFKGELERVGDLLKSFGKDVDPKYVRATFEALIHPRETIVRFGESRAVLCDVIDDEMTRLFDFYVDRSFATAAYVEQTITQRLNALLNTLHLPAPFRPERIGDELVHARFPLVQKRGVLAKKVIKPFNLNHAEPNNIFDHGDAWVQKVRRMRKRDLLPDDVLFAVASPPATDAVRFAAFDEIKIELERESVIVVPDAAEERIAAFAVA